MLARAREALLAVLASLGVAAKHRVRELLACTRHVSIRQHTSAYARVASLPSTEFSRCLPAILRLY